MKAFLTGSYAYGTPHKDSDVDLVVAVDNQTYLKLWELSENSGKLVFGNLNLVAFNIDDPKEIQRYHDWAKVNADLINMKNIIGPLTHEQACIAFANAGVDAKYKSGKI